MKQISTSQSSNGLLAVFLHDGIAYSTNELGRLDSEKKRLISQLCYCVLSCQEHIRYDGGPIAINLCNTDSGLCWEVNNWNALSPALRHALNGQFGANTSLPAPLHALTAA